MTVFPNHERAYIPLLYLIYKWHWDEKDGNTPSRDSNLQMGQCLKYICMLFAYLQPLQMYYIYCSIRQFLPFNILAHAFCSGNKTLTRVLHMDKIYQ